MNSKVTKTICYSLFRILLPLTLLAAAIVRFNALSFLYAVFLLITPLLSYPNVDSIKGATGNYLKILIALGAVAVLTQCIFHIVLVAIATDANPYGSMFTNCSLNERLAREIAVERLDDVPVVDVARLVVPDVAVFIVALVVFIICHVVLKKEAAQQLDLPTTQVRRTRRRRVNVVIEFFGEFLVSLLLGASGVILPSALNAVYFLTFLVVGTVWACYRKLGRKFAVSRVFLLIYTGLHILLLHLYQFQFFQEFLPPTDFIARIVGLTGIVRTDCSTTWMIEFHEDVKWPAYVNPGILLLLYWVLAFETRHWCHGTDVKPGSSAMSVGHGRRRKKRAGTERELLVDDAENTGYSAIEPINDDGTPKASTSKQEGAAADTDDEGNQRASRKEKSEQKRSPMVSVFVYLTKQSYVLMLIAMMAWSITLHSWLTFVLLLGACILWMIPKSRRACLVISPLVVIYAEALLIIQFIFGMDLEDKLPTTTGPVTYDEIGLKRFDIVCPWLALQVFYTFFFWLTLRQFMRERKAQQDHTQGMQMEPVDGSGPKQTSFSDFLNLPLETDMVDGYDSNSMKMIGNYLKVMLCKYWVFVCAAVMLAIAVQEVVLYRIIYMFLFLLFVIMFQLSFTVWRALMYVFWWVVIVYSMIVLIIVYTYQFSQFPGYWSNGTGLSNETLSDIGLETFDTAGLFIRLLTPTGFLIVVILQVHYFHTPFLRMSALDRYKREDQTDSTPVDYTTDEAGATTTDTESELSKKSKLWRARLKFLFFKMWNKASGVWEAVTVFLWRLTEIHIFKVVAFVIIIVAVNEVSAISAVYVILLAAILPLTPCHIVLSHVTMIWTALVILAKMMYQLKIVKTDYWKTNCTLDGNDTFMDSLYNASAVDFGNTSSPMVVDIFANDTEVDNAHWVGLDKIDRLQVSISYYIRNYLLILIVVAFESITRYHQNQHFNKPNLVRPQPGIIFPEIKRPEADKNIASCIKFFANYLFYKFGLEICYIMSAIAICVRVDAYSVIYAIFMGILLFTSRRTNARVWPLYVIVLAILLPVQFLSCVGIPYVLCIEYPWHNKSQMTQNLELWLFLPDYVTPPHAPKLVADFFQLLFVCLQWRVFSIERGPNSEAYGGGDNQSILPEVEANTEIPVEDFTTSSKSYLDVIKYAVFEYMFWVTLAIVFITGTTRINLFSMGYVIGVFCFMWYGQDLLLKPLRKLLRMWDFLIGYTLFVLFCKACLQLIGCVYIDRLYENECWLIQLLGINCLSSSITMPSTGTCTIERDDTGLTWDVVCFVFLLLQRRIYSSHYFRHVVSELEAQARLASRGAELINRIMIREVNRQNAQEAEILMNIKKQMKKLQTKQARLKKNFREPEDHYEAIRSGDYYLFDDDSGDEDAPDGADTLSFGQDRDDEGPKMGPLQVISKAMDSGTDAAVQKHKDTEGSQGGSTPGSPKVDPKAGPSGASQTEEGEELPPEKALGKLKRLGVFLLTILRSITDWFIRLFNKISKNYRLVARQLEKEMINEKEKIRAEKKNLMMKEKRGSTSSKSSDEPDGGGKKITGASADPDLVEVTVTPSDSGKPLSAFESSASIDWDERDREEEEFEKSQPRLYRLLVATYYVLVSRSEILCYFLMILNMMIYCSLLALPLPLMVFLWGMLSVPRPSKTFWITVITYIEAIVVVKYLFQFSFFPWNDGSVQNSPFWPPRILGIEKQSNYASADLALLLALFIHRSLLKRYGLWKDTDDISADLAKAGEKELSPPCSPLPEDDNTIRAIGSAELGQSGATNEIQSSSEAEGKKPPSKVKAGLKKCVAPFTNFFTQVTGSSFNATVDVYAPMFLCDFIVFLIVVFGYWAFGPAQTSGSGDVTSYISENRVPVPFLIMLICQFALIVIDRALFLRKNVLGKFIFQIILVIVVHIWMFFVLPGVTDRSFNQNIPALLWYFIKCIYFGLSAYQIRCGYPNRILGNFLTKKYNYVNLFLFKGFLAIPFVLELRALMDWIWTDTTLAIGSWLQLEDIYANIFVLKCWRRAESTYPTPRAQKRKTVIKYGVGGLLLLVIIFIIWFPLVLFSFANTVFIPNPPYESTVTITLGGYQPIFKMTAQQQNIHVLTENEYGVLQNRYSKDRGATGFLSNYEAQDVTNVSMVGKSTSLWGISPPSQDDLMRDLQLGKDIKIEYYVTFVRESTGGGSETVSNEFVMSLDTATKEQLLKVINGTANSTLSVDIRGLFPRFIRLGLKGRPEGVNSLLTGPYGIGKSNVSLSLQREAGTLEEFVQWWQVEELIQGDSILAFDPDKKEHKEDTITMFTFNDRKAPAGFSVITGYGIMGLYVSFILLIGRILRLSTTGLYQNIMFLQYPYVDRILRLCLDIYLVREMKEFVLEEDLFAKLIFFYRSPETAIKWTRKPAKKTN